MRRTRSPFEVRLKERETDYEVCLIHWSGREGSVSQQQRFKTLPEAEAEVARLQELYTATVSRSVKS